MDVNKMLIEDRAKMMELADQIDDQHVNQCVNQCVNQSVDDTASQAPNHHQLFELSDNTASLDNSKSLDTIKQLMQNS